MAPHTCRELVYKRGVLQIEYESERYLTRKGSGWFSTLLGAY